MRLCELLDIKVQGNIEIRLLDENLVVIDTEYFNSVERLSCRMGDKIPAWEDFEVIGIYPDAFTRKYPHSEIFVPYTVIEILSN